jgi:IPT/TIG domain
VFGLGTFPVMSCTPLRFSAVLVLGLLAGAAACGNDNPKLLVTGIEPDKGHDGSRVKIHGNRFTADGPRSVKVYFGGQPAQVDRFESDGELIVTAPGGKLNEAVDVLIVFDPGGKLTLPKAFHYIEKTDGPSVNDLSTNPNRKK